MIDRIASNPAKIDDPVEAGAVGGAAGAVGTVSGAALIICGCE